MAVLKSSTVERVYLPSTESLPADNPDKLWVDIRVGNIVAGDILGVDPEKDNDITASVKLLANRISDWCFTDESGAPVPVSFDTVKLLDIEDFSFLADKLTSDMGSGLNNAEKKT